MAEQVEATVLKIGQSPLLLTPQNSSFPTQEIIISEVVDEDINSSITYNGTIYYCSETKDALVTAANAGGGGGGTPTWQATLDVTGGSTLDKNNTITTGFQLFATGEGAKRIETTYNSEYGQVFTDSANVILETSDGVNTTNITVTKTEATIAKNGGTAKPIATVDYLVYTALITPQESEPAPAFTVLKNTLGTVTITNILSDGSAINIHCVGAFIDMTKIWSQPFEWPTAYGSGYLVSLAKLDDDNLELDFTVGAVSNITNFPLRIELYP